MGAKQRASLRTQRIPNVKGGELIVEQSDEASAGSRYVDSVQ